MQGIYVLEPELVNKVNPNTHIDMPNLLEKQIKEGKICKYISNT